MKRVGNLLMLLGLVVIGVNAVMRRIMKPSDFESLGLNRPAITLAAVGVGAALLLAGYLLQRSRTTHAK